MLQAATRPWRGKVTKGPRFQPPPHPQLAIAKPACFAPKPGLARSGLLTAMRPIPLLSILVMRGVSVNASDNKSLSALNASARRFAFC